MVSGLEGHVCPLNTQACGPVKRWRKTNAGGGWVGPGGEWPLEEGTRVSVQAQLTHMTCGHTHSHAHVSLSHCHHAQGTLGSPRHTALSHPSPMPTLTPYTPADAHVHPSSPFLKVQDTPRGTPILRLAHASSSTPAFPPTRIHARSGGHALSDMGKLLYKQSRGSHTWPVSPLLGHTSSAALTEGHPPPPRRAWGTLGNQAGPIAWARPRVGMRPWPGGQGWAAAAWAQPGCPHLC